MTVYVTGRDPSLCNWSNPPCKERATVRIVRSGGVFCEDHYLLNVLRFGCAFEAEKIPAVSEEANL